MNVYIHIGLHKTGTTFLQKHIFSKIKGINYIQNGRVNGLVGKYNTTLISNEALSGNPFRDLNKSYSQQFTENLIKLNEIFNQPKFIVGFREPKKLISSFYKQHLQIGGVLDFKNYYGSDNSLLCEKDLLQGHYYDFLINEFSFKNVFAYNHYDLLNSPDEIINSLLNFMQLPVDSIDRSRLSIKKENVSIPDKVEPVLLKLNKIDNSISKYGLTLNNKVFKRFRISPRLLSQYVFPKLLIKKGNHKIDRQLSSEVMDDWENLKNKISL